MMKYTRFLLLLWGVYLLLSCFHQRQEKGVSLEGVSRHESVGKFLLNNVWCEAFDIKERWPSLDIDERYGFSRGVRKDFKVKVSGFSDSSGNSYRCGGEVAFEVISYEGGRYLSHAGGVFVGKAHGMTFPMRFSSSKELMDFIASYFLTDVMKGALGLQLHGPGRA